MMTDYNRQVKLKGKSYSLYYTAIGEPDSDTSRLMMSAPQDSDEFTLGGIELAPDTIMALYGYSLVSAKSLLWHTMKLPLVRNAVYQQELRACLSRDLLPLVVVLAEAVNQYKGPALASICILEDVVGA